MRYNRILTTWCSAVGPTNSDLIMSAWVFVEIVVVAISFDILQSD